MIQFHKVPEFKRDMAISILIADSGATKTAWRLLENGKKSTFYTKGISPYYMTQHEMIQLMRKEFPKKILSKSIHQVHYYGTGCKTKTKANIVMRAIKALYPDASIHVTHDLMGAAIATCGNEKGIACILGTGSNSCYFNGSRLVANSPGLGYVLGDEASGAYFGKILLQHFLYKKLDDLLEKSFINIFKTNKEEILHHVYKEPFPNRYLAGFAKFLSMHRGHYIIENIIEDGFHAFMGTHLLSYPQSARVPVHFVGSIAFHFKDKIDELCKVYGFRLGQVIQNPIDGLTHFHLKKIAGKNK